MTNGNEYVWRLKCQISDGLVCGGPWGSDKHGAGDVPIDASLAWWAVSQETCDNYRTLHANQTASGRSPVEIICSGLNRSTRTVSDAPDTRPTFTVTPSVAPVDDLVAVEVNQAIDVRFDQTGGDVADVLPYDIAGHKFTLNLSGSPRTATLDMSSAVTDQYQVTSTPSLIISNPFVLRISRVGRAAS